MPGQRVPASKRNEIRLLLERVVPTMGGRLSNRFAEEVAELHGVSRATVWRVFNETEGDADRRRKPPSPLTRADKIIIAGANGSLARAHRELVRRGQVEVGYRAFLHQFEKLPVAERVGLLEGGRAAAEAGLCALQVIRHRLDRMHHDHTESDEYVHYRNQVARPWVSLLLDSCTRMILAAVVIFGRETRGDPMTETVVALLVQAMIGWEGPDGNRYGGIPATVAYDNALSNVASAVTNGFGMLGVYGYAIPPASPWRQGKVERAVRTITDELFAEQPGYVHQLTTRSGVPRAPDVSSVRHLDTFSASVDAFVEEYNFRRPHSALGGLTPSEKWNLDSKPVEFADPVLVRRWFMSDGQSRVVSGKGVSVHGIWYTDPSLPFGDKVIVRWLPSNRAFVDVYARDGEFLCTAVPHEDLSAEKRAAISRIRENAAGRTSTYIKESRRLRQEELREEETKRAIADPDASNVVVDDDFYDLLRGTMDGGDGQ